MTKFTPTVREAFPKSIAAFDEIQSEAEAWASRFREAKDSVNHGVERAQSKRQNNVELLVGISAAGVATRVTQLVDAVVGLVNDDNPHAAPPVARALFECCCVPIYLQRELVPRVKKGRTNQVHILVFKLGLGGTGAYGGYVKPIAVDALISSARAELKELEASLPEDERSNPEALIEIYYGPLSELTHPNWAALTLGIELDLPPRFSNPACFNEVVMHDVVASSAYIMNRGGLAFDEVLRELGANPMDLPNRDPAWREGDIRPIDQ